MSLAPLPPMAEMDRAATLAALRARVARMERGGAAEALERGDGRAIKLSPAIDAALPWGGLARAGLHEITGPDIGAVTAFAALILARTENTVLWIGPEPNAWPPGLARFGLRPEHLVFVHAGSAQDGLWAMEESLRCPGIGGALLELREIDLTAARRLQLAAESGGPIGLLLRGDAETGQASPALTRWRVSPIAGTGAAHDLGDPGWRLDLLRCRGGKPQSWETRWRASTDSLTTDDDDVANHSHLT
jgi:protein ImuA